MNSNVLIRMRQKEYQSVTAKTDKVYKADVIGERPERDTVWKELHNPNSTTFIQKMAIVLLIFASVFSIFKSINPSIQFADGFSAIAGFNPTLHLMFKIVTIVTNALIVSTGLVYTTMQATDPLTLEMINKHPMFKARAQSVAGMLKDKTHQNDSGIRVFTRAISLEAISPRLWQVLTYLVMAWLFLISSHGDGDIVIKYLPVVMEIALAHLVVEILHNWKTHSANVDKVLTLQSKEWDTKFASRHRNPEYLPILFQNLREALALMKRKGKRVNAWLDSASVKDVNDSVLGEYMWQSAGLTFAEQVTNQGISKAEKSATITKASAQISEVTNTENRIPPNGDKRWTPETLVQDFHARNLDPTIAYNQSKLDKDYQKGFAVRVAYRNGASDYFLGEK